jgi:hypothetical protein
MLLHSKITITPWFHGFCKKNMKKVNNKMVMDYPFAPKTVPTFLEIGDINVLYEDQHDHFVSPVMNWVKDSFENNNFDPRCHVIIAPPGSGKTTIFNVDLIWRTVAEAIKNGRKHNTILITSPDETINLDNYNFIQKMFENDDILDKLENDYDIDFRGVFNEPENTRGRGLEIIVCSIHKATKREKLKKLPLLLILSDELHRGLGSPEAGENNSYKDDVGHSNPEYEAKWFTAMNDLKSVFWIGMTGTPTSSMYNNFKFYKIISDKMEKSKWRLGFFASNYSAYQPTYEGNRHQVDGIFLELARRNAIGKYLKSKIHKTLFQKREIAKLKNTKITGLIKCGTFSSEWMGPEQVVSRWEKLKNHWQDKTFPYDGQDLPYHIGDCRALTSDLKHGGSNDVTVNDLNDEGNNLVAMAVIYIATVGINVNNMGAMACLPVVDNQGGVDMNLKQVIARMDRNAFVWQGKFDYEVAQIEDEEMRELIIKLAINTATKQPFATEGGLFNGAYSSVYSNHITKEGAYDYLSGAVYEKRERLKAIASGKERDLAYKDAQKDRCEREDCKCFEDFVTNPPIGSEEYDLSEEDRLVNYKKGLQVDHVDRDLDNLDPENLKTYCPNAHSGKTMKYEDYMPK